MPCYSPLKGWLAKSANPSGKRGIVFNPTEGFSDMPMEVPCGQCIGCRLERSRQWAMRCCHEASLHEDNCFITLTYDDKHLPSDAGLDITHFQKFMKRFRFSVRPKRIRFFHCGEYGECDLDNDKHLRSYGISALGRPHYHALIFGYDFYDRELYKDERGIKLYTSEELAQLWPFGFSTVGDVTFESAAYCARYVVKKINGEASEDHYTRINVETGETIRIKPEYVSMSRRPGIASDWYELYRDDVYPKDFTTIRGKRIKPPKFYDRRLESENEELFKQIKASRIMAAKESADDNTADRLAAKEAVKKAQVGMLKRKLNE